MEAQSLGRLKMASAYQLLLHARLVGLGKRFDRAVMTNPTTPTSPSSRQNGRRRRRRNSSRASGNGSGGGNDEEYDDDEEEYSEDDYEEEDDYESGDEDGSNGMHHSATESAMAVTNHSVTTVTAPPSALPPEPASSTSVPTTTTAAIGGNAGRASTANTEISDTASTVTTTIPLPNALQQLTSILPSNLEMDVAMMEHLARAAVELHHQRTGRKKSADGLLASPMTGLIGTPDQTNAANKEPASGGTTGTTTNNKKIAWTQEEQDIVTKAQTANAKITSSALAKLLKNKTESQVKAYLKNKSDRAKNNLEVEEEMTPRKRGGRGRKPPTTAMNTVPNANLDARSLLQGKILKIAKPSSQPTPTTTPPSTTSKIATTTTTAAAMEAKSNNDNRSNNNK